MGKEVVLGGNKIENKHVSTCLLLEEKNDHQSFICNLKKEIDKS